MEFEDIDGVDDPRVEFVEAKTGGWAGTVAVQALYAALEKHGVPKAMWPSPPKDNRCLERGMKDQTTNRRLKRPLKGGRGWALVVEDVEALDLEKMVEEPAETRSSGVVEVTAKVERAETDGHVSTLRITPEDHPAAPMIRESFRHHRGSGGDDLGQFLCSQDLSQWFTQGIIPWVGGVTSKSRGGSYFVLKGENYTRLMGVVNALEEVSFYKKEYIMSLPNGKDVYRTAVVEGGRIIVTPQLTTAGNIEQLIGAVLDENDKKCDGAHETLTNGTPGIRALTTQSDDLDRMGDKIKQIEAVLGASLTAATERLNETLAASGMMKLKLEAEKDKKDKAA